MWPGFRHLRAKLTVLYATLFVATLTLVAFAVYAAASRNVEQTGRSQLAAAGVAFDNMLASRDSALQDKAELLSKDYGFRAAVASSDRATVRSALTNLARRLGIDVAYVVDARGVVTAQDPALDGVLPADVLSALEADDPVSGLFQFRGRPYQAVSTPIMMPAPSGWVVFAAPLDKGEMSRLDRLSAIPLQAGVVGRRPGDNWGGIAASAFSDPRLAAFAKAASSNAAIARLRFSDGDSLVLAHRLPTLGHGDQVLMLRYPVAAALKPFNSLVATILIVGLCGMALLVFGSWLIARTVTRPISELEAAAQALQHGEAARVRTVGIDEIARLGHSFNAMAEGIRQREQSLEQARDAARAADRAKGEFLANVNHELRTPLNGVLGSASVLASTPLAPEQRRMLDLIQGSGQGLLHILNDVLDMVELGAGALRLTNEPFALSSVLESEAADARDAAHAKGLGFTFDAAATAGVWLAGDGRRVRQILANLLDNAVKFTDRGEVTLSASRSPSGQWWLEVADTGVGFGPAAAEAIFEPFTQADGSMTRRFGGTGMGLSLARELARGMGGDIGALGAPGQGARFTLCLNLQEVSAPTAEPPLVSTPVAPSAEEGAAPLRVLLAEDNPANRAVVELILSALNAQLTMAENGAEAVEAFRTQAFDVVLMDLQMPVMDGLTAIAHIRRHEARCGARRTPIIVVSANVQSHHLQASTAGGADLHVAKPITSAALIGALAQVLNPPEEPSLAQSA